MLEIFRGGGRRTEKQGEVMCCRGEGNCAPDTSFNYSIKAAIISEQ